MQRMEFGFGPPQYVFCVLTKRSKTCTTVTQNLLVSIQWITEN
jgi:hypothetical protein